MAESNAKTTLMGPPSPPFDCKICKDIWRQLTKPEDRPEINLGSFDDAVLSGCPIHTPLLERFRDYCLGIEEPASIAKREPEDVGFWGRGGKESSACLIQSISKGGLCWNLLLVNKETVSDHPGTGCFLDPDWVDFDKVKQWKNKCLSLHGPSCENPMKIHRIRPAWLIDVENKCIVSGESCDTYVALSYHWAQDARFKIDSAETMVKLQSQNALDNLNVAEQLPLIVRHAMYLTSVIGERYLWVDALCIDHSDVVATGEQLNLMGAIYASAIITIIAADGDSEHGIQGLKGVSTPRKLKQTAIPFGDEMIIKRNTGIFSMGSGTAYHGRGWTYQEYKMAPRRILFINKEVHWVCQCSVWHEELTFGTEVDKYLDPRLQVILAGFPDLDSLAHMITDYNTRDLCYDEDALPGISGLLAVVSRTFSGGFLYGHPEMLFDRSLGWRPYWSHTDLRRRIPSDRSVKHRLKSSALPSWSWVGWQGLLTIGHGGDSARINDRQYRIEETIPITEWYTSSSPSGSPLRRIRSTWFENRDTFKNFSNPLPAGWTAYPAKGGEGRLYPEGCHDRVFKHCDMPDEDCEYWYYPFPVAKIQESTPLFTPEQTPYIFCQTKRAHLWARPIGDKNKLVLSNEAGTNIGSLHLHNEEQQKLFINASEDNGLGRRIELAAIYRSRAHSKNFDQEQKVYTYPHTLKETYKVLWVEWEEGIAYRLASGDVEKADWEALELEDVSLILG